MINNRTVGAPRLVGTVVWGERCVAVKLFWDVWFPFLFVGVGVKGHPSHAKSGYSKCIVQIGFEFG